MLSKWKWFYKDGYAQRTEYLGKMDGKYKYRTVKMHRLILNPEKTKEVDHISGDRLDNRRSNLRVCSKAENQANQSIARNNSSGFKGVHKFRGRWQAYLYSKGKRYHLGYHNTREAAAIAYNDKAREVFGEFARLNPIGVSP